MKKRKSHPRVGSNFEDFLRDEGRLKKSTARAVKRLRSARSEPFVKTTLELPDALLQRIKLRAARCKRNVNDEVAALLEAGLAHAHAPLAQRKPPKPVRLRGRRPVTLSEIASAIDAGRVK